MYIYIYIHDHIHLTTLLTLSSLIINMCTYIPTHMHIYFLNIQSNMYDIQIYIITCRLCLYVIIIICPPLSNITCIHTYINIYYED